MRVLVLALTLCLAVAVAPAASAGPVAPACYFVAGGGGVVGLTVDYVTNQCVEVDGIVFGGGSVVGLVENTQCYLVGQNC